MHEDPVYFNITVIQDYDQRLDSKIKELRRIPKPKNETDVEKSDSKLTAEDLIKNMDESKLNMTKEQLEEMIKNLKNYKMDGMQEKMEKMK